MNVEEIFKMAELAAKAALKIVDEVKSRSDHQLSDREERHLHIAAVNMVSKLSYNEIKGILNV